MTDQTYCEAPDCEGARERGASGRALAVCVKGFSFAYPEGEQILDELDFSVEEGAFALLVGATGSGKTTLLRSLKPEVAPVGERSGELRVFGEDLAGLSTEQSASLIGFVSQNPANQIVCDRVWHELAFGLENLGVPRSVMHRRIAETSHFFGIEPLMDRATTELSGGQQQLVNLAAVLSLRPKVLLLDEPTGFLDPVTEKSFLHALFRVNRELGITVVVSTHSPESMVDYATVCFEMKQGKIENVSHDRFKARDAMSEDVARLRRELRAGAEEKRAFGPTVVDVHDVRFRYHRDMPDVLRGCDFSVAAGSVHALVGGNGSGKSTLLSLIAGIRKPGRGRVRSDLASKQVLLPQDPKALFVCDTVAEELAEWGPRCGYGEEEIARAVERFNLAGLERRHPYDLSGGQQQRLAWAKALLTNPELVLMDEPTKGLDAPSRLAAAQSLLELVGEGRTVVMVTHDLMFTALVADSVSMLFDGEIACTEPAQEFFDGNVFYRPALDSLARIIEEESAC